MKDQQPAPSLRATGEEELAPRATPSGTGPTIPSVAQPPATVGAQPPGNVVTATKKRFSAMQKSVGAASSALLFIIGIALIVAFVYYNQQYHFSAAIRSWGWIGIAASILLMALLCIVPIPSEFLLVMDMNVYGIARGIFYSWVGVMVGTMGIFWMARSLGRPILKSFVSEERVNQVENWVSRRGSVGLLMARLLPVPASVVNYIAGLLKSVTWWDYLWTAAVGMVPYYTGAAFIYLGVSKRIVAVLVFGVAAIAVLWIGGYIFNQRRAARRNG